MFQYLEPEVSGGFGDGTELDNSVHPPIVKKLNYEFEGWHGNDIVESFPCYLVTESLKISIEQKGLAGVKFANVEVTTTDTFRELYPNIHLPQFYWMKIEGKLCEDDFGLAEDLRLVISSRVAKVLESFNISEAEFEEYES